MVAAERKMNGIKNKVIDPKKYLSGRIIFILNYAAKDPGWIELLGSRREKPPSGPETAKIMPLLSKPRIVRGSRLVTNMQVLPTRTAGSGKCIEIPDTI